MDGESGRKFRENPFKKANILSLLTFSWFLPVFFEARRNPLDLDGLYEPLNAYKAGNLGDKLASAWDKEVKCCNGKNSRPKFIKALISVFWNELFQLGVILIIVDMIFRFSQPFLLGKLIDHYKADKYEVYIYSSAIIIASTCNVLSHHSFMHKTMHFGMKIKVAVSSLIYRKTLRLSKSALIDTTSGNIINLMSGDVARLDMSVHYIHYLWLGPLETTAVLIITYKMIGISAIFGIIFLLSFTPLQLWLGKKTTSFRLKTASRTDQRIHLMNEIIQGIQVIKMYAWERVFAGLIRNYRENELKIIKFVSYIKGTTMCFVAFVTRTSIFISLVTFAILGNVITAKEAFVITSYYNFIRHTMTMFFPLAVGFLAEAIASLKRVENFLLQDEITKDPQQLISLKTDYILSGKEVNGTSVSKIHLHKLNAKWNSESNEPTLEDISLEIQPGSLTMVIGAVGSGKSSLLQAILGELPLESGLLKTNGTYSYAAQEPWLFSESVRQNILFGMRMDKERYKNVLNVCSLNRDIEMWPNGENTLIGERGHKLSGGQKARISLARAIYRDTDIYLLDDILSAVDSHVSRHLFERCIKGFLKGKTIVLVTHQLQYLPDVDQIMLLHQGKMKFSGTFEDFKSSKENFVEMLNMNEAENNDMKNIEEFEVSEKDKHDNGALKEKEETRETGSVKFEVYRNYLNAGGNCVFFLVVFMFSLSQFCASSGDMFLSYWVGKEENRQPFFEAKQFPFNEYLDTAEIDNLKKERYFEIYTFAALTIGLIAFVVLRSISFYSFTIRASQRLHDAMCHGIIKAPMYFFFSNPSGRILNRFSKDIGQIDEYLPGQMSDLLNIFLSLFGCFLIIAIVNPISILPAAVLMISFYFMRNFYLTTSRMIKRIDGTTRSPIFSHLSASIEGLPTIRAFNAENILINEFNSHQNLNTSACSLFISASRAFGFYLDVFCLFYITFVTVSLFMTEQTSGSIGLIITQALGITGIIQWGMRQSAELENTMTSVERVVEYSNVEPEKDRESKPDRILPESWPENGHIKFDKLSLKYNPNPESDVILKELEFEVLPKEKIGIVGRTGAGKSSIIYALFRLSYNEGSILIDSQDTKSIKLQELRSKISIIPQEPVLFSNTIKFNLDPFEIYTDEEIWKALEDIELKETIQEFPEKLLTEVSEGGSNFSVGQRQLMCLARAILRNNKILVMDEATANVDIQTDSLIQSTIREKFKECTVLTVAHRLNTIIDSDKIMVIDSGKCVEFGSPYELLTKKEEPKIFYEMLKQTGANMFEGLMNIAEENYQSKKLE